MKNLYFNLFIILMINSCSDRRIKDKDEIVLHENIVEKKGVYYSGDCEIHSDKKYTGTDNYFFENGKVKGTYTIKDGLPNGHWSQFNENGSKKIDLYYEDGKLIIKIKHKIIK